ncbi:hypothetical protein ACT3SZ_04280 [Corynebacterium sp. AOP40-9SA-29]|uniref:hypothetical protein n=1 Tax=Corynebacterium sp. AOP40-9SA-29 TaxID=3457677 RepID=UPI004033F84B
MFGRDRAKTQMRRNIAKANDGQPAGTKGSRAQTSVVGGTAADDSYEAASHTEAPLNEFMVRLLAQEMPVLDSTSRRIINQELRDYDGPTITCVAELPETVREVMEL